jgi:chemotaxis protein MotA
VSTSQRRFDLGAVIGLPLAIGVVLLAHMIEGGSARSLWQPAAAMIVFGGTIGAVLVSYPFAIVKRTVLSVWQTFGLRAESPERIVSQLIEYAHRARRKGTVTLENDVDRIPEPFLRNALMLAVDGAPAETVRQVLDVDHGAQREAAEAAAEVLETASGYTPTLGILGAVLGLIHVMESLSEPSKLGPGIAVAFVATVYGVATANLVLLPLATKLRGQARREALRREIIIEGIVALQQGLNPRLIEQKLHGYLTPTRPEKSGRRAA